LVIKIPRLIISLEPLSADRAVSKNRKIFFTKHPQNAGNCRWGKGLSDPEGNQKVSGMHLIGAPLPLIFRALAVWDSFNPDPDCDKIAGHWQNGHGARSSLIAMPMILSNPLF
jgi:hypothetical protein